MDTVVATEMEESSGAGEERRGVRGKYRERQIKIKSLLKGSVKTAIVETP